MCVCMFACVKRLNYATVFGLSALVFMTTEAKSLPMHKYIFTRPSFEIIMLRIYDKRPPDFFLSCFFLPVFKDNTQAASA